MIASILLFVIGISLAIFLVPEPDKIGIIIEENDVMDVLIDKVEELELEEESVSKKGPHLLEEDNTAKMQKTLSNKGLNDTSASS